MGVETRKRFEVSLPVAQWAALEQLAEEAGVSSAGLARVAIVRLLNDPTSLTGRKEPVRGGRRVSAPIIFLPVIPVLHHHQEPANEPAAAVQATASIDAVAATTRAEHECAAFLNAKAFEQAERLAEGARQSAVAAAAAKLQALGNAKTPASFDHHNAVVRDAEKTYLQTVISAAERYGVLSHGWRAALQALPPVVSHATWMAGKGKW